MEFNQMNDKQWEKDQDQEEWMNQLKTWRLNGTECAPYRQNTD